MSINSEQSITLSEALETYITQKGAGKPKTFKAAAQRACSYIVDACGAKTLAEYTRGDALWYWDYLIAKGLVGSSVSRVISLIRAVFNFAISEYALDFKNPFVGMYFGKSAGVSKRLPIPIDDILKVQHLCRKIDDDLRWLVALVSDTGMRLAEGAGLLKTSCSQRDIPLAGASLWAAQRLSGAFPSRSFAFPRYNRKDTTNSNSASAALNKWLHQYVPDGCTMHSFRHSMRDRLRAVERPSDIIDQIGGWATQGVGQGYGGGYELNICAKWITMVSQK